jgi:hypothetical protein
MWLTTPTGGAITLAVVGAWAAIFPQLRQLKHLR